MYCVKCGVQLPEGAKRCPLCSTPVWCPDTEAEPASTYSDRYPIISRQRRITVMSLITVALLAAMVACLSICLHITGKVGWSAYVLSGCLCFYTVCLLPFWFKRPHPMVFVPVAFGAALALLLFINWYTGGHWFWPFAFPVTMIVAALTIGALALYRYVKGGTLFITGGLLMALGGASMLIELFTHLVFSAPMFGWSLYGAVVFGIFGGFLILSGIIRPLREHLERTFFI